MKKFALKTFAAIALTAFGVSAQADNVTATTTAVVVAPISSTVVTQLSFGRFAPKPTETSVETGAQGGWTGTAILMDAPGVPGLITMTGEPDAYYILSGDSMECQDLSNGAGNTMRACFDYITSGNGAVAYEGTFDATGNATVNIGGTLIVPANAPAGTYTGTRTIAVNYN